MNAVDLIIIAAVGLLAFMGLKSGLLKPVLGIGGLILGGVLGFRYHDEVAPLLVEYIDREMWRNVVGFIAILLAVAVAARIAATLIKSLLSVLFLGWVDHVAGALGGTAVGIVLVGTAVYLLTGADLAPTREALAASKLAPKISGASLVSSDKPWCSSLVGDASENSQDCTDLKGLANQFLGRKISGKVDGLLEGKDLGTLADVIKGTLTGSPEDVTDLVKEQRPEISGKVDGLLGGQDIGTLVDVIKGTPYRLSRGPRRSGERAKTRDIRKGGRAFGRTRHRNAGRRS